MKFIVINEIEKDKFEEEVNKYLEKGYLLVDFCHDNHIYYQTMVLDVDIPVSNITIPENKNGI